MDNKERISMTIDPKLLERIDAVAAERGEARSAVIDRMLANEIREEEAFIKSMANPVIREMTLRIANSPRLMKALATLVGDEFDDAHIERAKERTPTLRAMGKRLQNEKRRGGKGATECLAGGN